MRGAFDEHAQKYDGWFLENLAVLESEVRLLAAVLTDAGRTLSIGCGTGLFEKLLLRVLSLPLAAVAQGQDVEITANDGEQVVEIMSDAACHAAHGLHLFHQL